MLLSPDLEAALGSPSKPLAMCVGLHPCQVSPSGLAGCPRRQPPPVRLPALHGGRAGVTVFILALSDCPHLPISTACPQAPRTRDFDVSPPVSTRLAYSPYPYTPRSGSLFFSLLEWRLLWPQQACQPSSVLARLPLTSVP